MCKAVRVTNDNALVYTTWSDHWQRFDVGLSRLQVNINADSYEKILKETGGMAPEKVRTYHIQFLTEDYEDMVSNLAGFEDDEITLAYFPVLLMPGPHDQNLITFVYLKKSDVNNNIITIPDEENGRPVDQASWRQIISLYDITLS